MGLVQVLASLLLVFTSGTDIPTREIAHGVQMPVVSIGTGDGKRAGVQVIVQNWLSLGNRGIDTAWLNLDQSDIAKAISNSSVQRKELFITSKIATCDPTVVGFEIGQNLRQLKTDYFDLVLIHTTLPQPLTDTPVGFPGGCPAWKVLEKFVTQGKVKSIGVSNWSKQQLQTIMRTATIPIAVNQIKYNPFKHDDDTIAYCHANNITVEAHSPLHGGVFTNPVLKSIATAHNVSVAQVALKWIVQRGDVLTVLSSNRDHQANDADLWHFTLTDDEMDQITNLKDSFANGLFTKSKALVPATHISDTLVPATTISLVPGGKAWWRVCDQFDGPFHDEIATIFLAIDPFMMSHTKVNGTCASQGYDKYIGQDPGVWTVKLFIRSKAPVPATPISDTLVPATPISLVPGGKAWWRVCDECPNNQIASIFLAIDPFMMSHTKVNGTCASQGYDKYIGRDPGVFTVKLFIKSKAPVPATPINDQRDLIMVRSQGSIKKRLCTSEGCKSGCTETEYPVGKCLGGLEFISCSSTGASWNVYDDPSCSGTPMTKTAGISNCLSVGFGFYFEYECGDGAAAPASSNSVDHRGANPSQSLITFV